MNVKELRASVVVFPKLWQPDVLALLDLCERQHAALKALEDVQGFMMIGHPGSRHDKAFVGCGICDALAAGRAAGLGGAS